MMQMDKVNSIVGQFLQQLRTLEREDKQRAISAALLVQRPFAVSTFKIHLQTKMIQQLY